jgi:RNA polymerase sigma-70 factor, ECF subfamily
MSVFRGSLRRPNRQLRPQPAAPRQTPRDRTYHVEEQTRLLRNALRNALDVLTPEERRVIETAFFSELTYLEVAERLDQPLGTVKTRIRSGLGKLRQALAGIL